MRVRDCDGDIWESDSEGEWALVLVVENGAPVLDSSGSRLPTLKVLEQMWGPLSEEPE
jgi:hypothetical protein